jgi:hypothetical protein
MQAGAFTPDEVVSTETLGSRSLLIYSGLVGKVRKLTAGKTALNLGVAQSGSVVGLEPSGLRFKSYRLDQFIKV